MIVKYIVKSLEQRETIFVSGLGLFEKYYQSAQIVDDKIIPPFMGVKFDPTFDGNGFNFEMFVAQQEGQLISESSIAIEEWVRNLKNAIDNNKSVSFENFGTFAKDAKGVITFECDKIDELNLEFEGLNPVATGHYAADAVAEDMAENEETNVTEEETPLEEPQEIVSEINEEVFENQEDNGGEQKEVVEKQETEAVVESLEETSDNQEEETETEEASEMEEEKSKPKHKGLIITIIVILILALLLAAAYSFRTQLLDLYHQYFVPDNEVVTEEPVQETTSEGSVLVDTTMWENDTISSKDNNNQEFENEHNTNVSSSNASQENMLKNDGGFFVDYEKGKYYVIVGSFRTEKEVRRHINEKRLDSYHPKVVRQAGQNLRVCIGIFTQEQAAEDFGRQSGMNYWVLK